MSKFTIGEKIQLWNWAGSRMKQTFKVVDIIQVNGEELVFIKEPGLFNRTFYNTADRISEHLVTTPEGSKE